MGRKAIYPKNPDARVFLCGDGSIVISKPILNKHGTMVGTNADYLTVPPQYVAAFLDNVSSVAELLVSRRQKESDSIKASTAAIIRVLRRKKMLSPNPSTP